MNTFIIQPTSSDAKLAIGAVKSHITKYKYPHYIKVYGKTMGRINKLSHIDIITDRVKAIQEGCCTPQEWLDLYHRPVTNIINKTIEENKLC